MPVTIKKSGEGYVVVEKDSGKVKSHHASREKAEAAARLRNAIAHGYKPKNRRRGQ